MTDAKSEELTSKIDSIWEAITRLEARVAEIASPKAARIHTDHPHIVRVQGVCGGHPVIEGTRLSVKLVVGWARMGMTPEEIAAQYPDASIVQIADALAYYKDHPEEIEAEFAEERRYLDVEIPRLQTMIAKHYERTD
jgi:uncharacterized protein (DUF433 family)